jgi:hypothetical protein
MTVSEIIEQLESLGSPDNVAGMERFGIVTTEAFERDAYPGLRPWLNYLRTFGAPVRGTRVRDWLECRRASVLEQSRMAC